MSPLKGRHTKMPAPRNSSGPQNSQARVPAPLKPLLLVRGEAGATREKGDGSKRGLKEKAKVARGALRLRQRGCGFELWRDHDRLRCT